MSDNTDQKNITIADYSPKSIVVRGKKTIVLKGSLKDAGGKWNRNLRGGPGWIFPKTCENVVRQLCGDDPVLKDSPVNRETQTPPTTPEICCTEYARKFPVMGTCKKCHNNKFCQWCGLANRCCKQCNEEIRTIDTSSLVIKEKHVEGSVEYAVLGEPKIADAWYLRLLSSYAPQGYGTSLRSATPLPDGKVYLIAHRFSSCD